jgi:PAS domain S-box-containing protein
LALEAADMGTVDVDAQTYFADLGGRTAQILGLGEGPMGASCATLLSCVDPEDRERVSDQFRRCAEHSEPCTLEFRHTGSNGRRRWIRAYGRGFAGDRSPRKRMVGVVQDVTEEKSAAGKIRQLNDELEATVRSRTAELQASLDDMNTFSYSVAHDLRAPLRAVLGFSERLKEDFSAQMDEEGRHYIERVHIAGRRMSEVIDALLSLSRLTRIELRREHVNLSDMVAREVQSLREEQPQRNIDCTIEQGVVVDADAALLRIVVENLLRNAWKFTSKHSTARIEFGCMDAEGGTAYFISDDGAGFEDSRSSQLFVPFRRLHLARDFEGIGVGLATVQRIVQRHGGKIWATGAPEKGARFCFTLGEDPLPSGGGA